MLREAYQRLDAEYKRVRNNLIEHAQVHNDIKLEHRPALDLLRLVHPLVSIKLQGSDGQSVVRLACVC